MATSALEITTDSTPTITRAFQLLSSPAITKSLRRTPITLSNMNCKTNQSSLHTQDVLRETQSALKLCSKRLELNPLEELLIGRQTPR